jgi:RecA/RadA recombinase
MGVSPLLPRDDARDAALGTSSSVTAGSPATRTMLSLIMHGVTVVATGLAPLDALLLGGLPRGMVTEVVGASGAGKSVLCQAVAAHAAASPSSRGEPQRVVVLDVDGRWSATALRHMLARVAATNRQQAATQKTTASAWAAPSAFAAGASDESLAAAAHSRLHLIRSIQSLDDLWRGMPELQALLIGKVGLALLVVDSFASLVRASYSGHPDETMARTEAVLAAVQTLKCIAEGLGIAVLLTSHAGSSDGAASGGFSSAFKQPLREMEELGGESTWMPGSGGGGGGAAAAFGTSFYHAVNTRIVLEELLLSGRRMRVLRVGKSPLCPHVAFEMRLVGDPTAADDGPLPSSHVPMAEGEHDGRDAATVTLRDLAPDIGRVVCGQRGVSGRAHFHVMVNNGLHATAPRLASTTTVF